MWDLYCLYRDYPQLFQMLVDMQKDSFIPFRPTKDLYKIKQEFDSGKIPKNRSIKITQLDFFNKINKGEDEDDEIR